MMDGDLHQEFRRSLDESAEELGDQIVADIPSTPVEVIEQVSNDANPDVRNDDREPRHALRQLSTKLPFGPSPE